MRACALLLVLAGCQDLPDLGTCGNGIVEADLGEACDGTALCTTTCELACDAGTCPDGQTCAIDNVCRAPSGQFVVSGIAQPFDVTNVFAGDFNADLVDDLVGTGIDVVVRYGSSTEIPFTDGLSQPAPSSHGPLVIFERDLEDATDKSALTIAVPTEGVAFLASDTETFAPQIKGVFPIDNPGRGHAVLVDDAPDKGDVVVEFSRQGPIEVKRLELGSLVDEFVFPACGNNANVFSSGVSRDRHTLVLALAAPGVSQWRICRYQGTQATPFTVAGEPPDSVELGNVDGDACEELVTTRIDVDQTIVAFVDASGPDCVFAGTQTVLNVLDERLRILATGSIKPTASDRDELVMNNGVFEITAGNLVVPLVRPVAAVRWSVATVADLDNDGILDVVAGRVDEEDVDVVRGGPSPATTKADTAAIVTRIVAGRFDSDHIDDVAFVEHSGSGERVSILHGTASGNFGPVQPNSRFQGELQIARMSRAFWNPTLRAVDALDDLFVIQKLPNVTEGTGGVLIGDDSLLTMPRLLSTETTTIGTLVAGKLDGTTVSVAAIRPSGMDSELAILPFEGTVFTSPVALPGFVVDTTVPGALLHTPAAPLLAVFGQGLRVFDAMGVPCTGTADVQGTMHPLDLDGDGFDELAVIDNTMDRRVRVYTITGGPTCAIGAELMAEELAPCTELIRTGSTLVAGCPRAGRSGLFRIVDGVREDTPFVELDGTVQGVITGDFDGDGVPDLAVGLLRGAVISVQLVRQCPAHDTRGCT
ncbi:MAG: hypothetical protein ABI867_44200 [Kofleriaceae bacterium]